MAVPTIIRILPAGTPVGTPAEGATSGRSLLEIYGGGFRLPPPFTGDGPSGPVSVGTGLVKADTPATVRVTFGGVEAEKVEVIRSNLLYVTTPISPIPATKADNHGEGPVDVTITNLDDSGDPIPGETVTLEDGFTFRRPRLDTPTSSNLTRVVIEFIEQWKRQVLPETILTQHTDWDADTATAVVDVAKIPSLVLQGPTTVENRFYSLNEPQEIEITEDRVEVRKPPLTVDLLFEVVGISDSTEEIFNLLSAASTFMRQNTVLEVYRDPGDPSKGKVRYELAFQEGGHFKTVNRPSASNLRFFTGSVVIRGFDFEAFEGLPADELRDLTRTLAEDPTLDVKATGE